MYLLKEDDRLPSITDTGRYPNEKDLDEILLADTVKYWMWKVYEQKEDVLFSCIVPFLNSLYSFFALGDNPNKGWMHQYISVGGHMPMVAVYFPILQQEYVLDNGNTYYHNHTIGYSTCVYEIQRCLCTPERMKYLSIDPTCNGIVIDYFPMGKSGYRDPTPVRTIFDLRNKNILVDNDYYKKCVRVYRNTLHDICNIINKYSVEMSNKVSSQL